MKKGLFERITFIIIGILWLYFSFFHCFDDDEFQHCHNAFLIWNGLTPYKDFFEHHIPLYHIFFSPLFISGSHYWTIFLFRIISLLCSFWTFSLIYRYLKKNYDSSVAVISLILLAFVPMYLIKMTEARPESIAVMFFTIATMSIISENKNSFISGLFSGLMCCFSQKYFFPWIGLFGANIIITGRKNIKPFIAGSFIAFVPLVLYLFLKGIVPEFINSTIIMNFKWKYRFSPAGYLYEMFITAGFLVACGISGIIGEFFIEKNKKMALSLLCLLTGCFLGIFIVPVPYRQIFLPVFIVTTIASGWTIHKISGIVQQKKLKILSGIILIFCAISSAITSISKEFQQTNFSDINKMKKIDSISPDTTFFDGRCLLYYRMHTGYYGFMHHELLQMLDPEKYSHHIIESLKKNNFPVVIYDYRVKEMPSQIQDFIQKHYCLASEPDIYLPGVNIDRSQLTGGKTDFDIFVSGWYRIYFRGENLLIDGTQVRDNTQIFLQAGNHIAETDGFVEQITMILEGRK